MRQFQLNEWNKASTTSVRAGNQDGDWLNVDFMPGTAPNTGMYWCPVLYTAMTTPAVNVSGNFIYYYDWVITLEVRGTK